MREEPAGGGDRVLAIVNGQRLEVTGLDVQAKLREGVCEIAASSTVFRVHAGLIFILSLEERPGLYECTVAAHDFSCLYLRYSQAELHEQLQQLAQSIFAFTRSQSAAGEPASLSPAKPAESMEDDEAILEREYASMGLINERWRLTRSNRDFQVCATYPRSFIVPAEISDSVIRHAARFRARGRLPILSWLHPNGSALTRSSQALVGLQRHTSPQDVHLVSAIRHAAPSKTLLVVDARPKSSAMANAVTGGGFMPLERYEGCSRVYLGIENIHAVREAYLRVFSLLRCGTAERTAKLESGWTAHYTKIMEGVNIICTHLEEGMSVLVHCSDGWDRTAQLVSLTQICLDVRCRTISGFLGLIQREWICGGHQFETRLARSLAINSFSINTDHPKSASNRSLVGTMLNGLSRSSHTLEEGRDRQDEFCPIFPQFLDCVRQLLRVYPRAFEFDARLLDRLLIEAHVPHSPAFHANCEKDRYGARVHCLEAIVGNDAHFVNRLFEPASSRLQINNDVLFYL